MKSDKTILQQVIKLSVTLLVTVFCNKIFAQEKISSDQEFISAYIIEAKLDNTGTLSGKITVYDVGFAYRTRRSLMQQQPDHFRENFRLDHFVNLKILSAKIDSSESGKWTTTINFSLPSFGKVNDHEMNFMPVLVPMINENPYTEMPETFPFYLAYPTSFSYELEIDLPQGYAASEVPHGMNSSYENVDAYVKRFVNVDGSHLSFLQEVSLNQIQYTAPQYIALKQLLDDYFSQSSEQVSLLTP